jgi:endonuclease G
MASKEERVAQYLSRVAAQKPGRLERLIRRRPSGTEESLESAEETARVESARAGLREVERGNAPSPEQTASLEAIILPDIRPVLDVIDGSFYTDHPLWEKLNEEGPIRSGLLKAVRSVGRIE